MKKLFLRVTSVVLVLFLLFSVWGCQTWEPVDVQNTEKVTQEEPAKTDSVTKKLVAKPYLQEPYLSWSYSFEINVDNDKVYLNDILYDQISYEEELDILYGDALLRNADVAGGEQMLSTLEKIKKQNGYYVLATQATSKFGQKIVICEIENSYYFLALAENDYVYRIHTMEK